MKITGTLLFVAFLVVFFFSGCKKSETPQTPSSSGESTPGKRAGTSSPPADMAAQPAPSNPANAQARAKPKTDACALLTNFDVESVQKETKKQTNLTVASQ